MFWGGKRPNGRRLRGWHWHRGCLHACKSVLIWAGNGTGTNPTDLNIDELRVGTTWGDVTPTPTSYFDVNGTSTGSGVVAGGTYTWEAANWASDGQGGNGSQAWISGNTAVFAADQDSTGTYSSPNTNAYTVNLTSNETASSLVVNEGTVTFSGAFSLTISNGLINVTGGVATGGVTFAGTAIFSNTLTLNLGTNFVKAGTGSLILNGDRQLQRHDDDQWWHIADRRRRDDRDDSGNKRHHRQRRPRLRS